MKRAFLVVGLIVLSGALAVAGPFGMGVKGGTPLAWAFGGTWDDDLAASDEASNAVRAGASVGAFAYYDVGRFFTIQVEALVGLYNWAAEGSMAGEDFAFSSQLFLVEVPLLVKVRLPVWRGAFTILAGPELFMGIGKIDSALELGSDPPVEDSADSPLSDRWILAVVGGIGYDLPLGPGFLSFDARYVRLVVPLVAEYEIGGADLEHYVHSVNFYLGYGFRFGR